MGSTPSLAPPPAQPLQGPDSPAAVSSGVRALGNPWGFGRRGRWEEAILRVTMGLFINESRSS